ncbi:MAG TPA: NUDIX hydrolase [Caldithrix abyssi]|uniref:GDP-mannose pyrophosphatase n=1 Tax=Caldithrix abyssi TaxID=187145 RepID=A0A7V5RNX4_CALAY|nr:NUDIX hydrolase [Caldithrix abyssi]
MSHKNPWKTLSTREIYKNPWIRLREDRVVTPGGRPGIYSVVEARPAIGIVPLTENLDTYLVGQYRYALQTYSWEIPEGGGLEGENTLDGAKRELKEETGLSANKWDFLGTLYTSNCFTNEVGYVYLARELTEGVSRPDDTEDLHIRRLPFEQAWQMVLEQEIRDALAVIGLTRAYFYLKQKGHILF